MIVETTGANGSVHSSYLLVDALDARSVISSLVVAVNQLPAKPSEEQQQQHGSEDEESDASSIETTEEEEPEIKAQIFVDCQHAGTVTLAGSFKTMMQSTGRLEVVRTFDPSSGRQ